MSKIKTEDGEFRLSPEAEQLGFKLPEDPRVEYYKNIQYELPLEKTEDEEC